MPVSAAASPRFQAWLRHRNANGWNVYVSVNAVLPGRSRTRRSIAAVRHVFLEEDADGPGLLAALTTRPDLPPPSYVLHSSPGRLHVLWRTQRLQPRRRGGAAEALRAGAPDRSRGHVVLADDPTSGLHESQARTPLAGLYRVPAAEHRARACGLSGSCAVRFQGRCALARMRAAS